MARNDTGDTGDTGDRLEGVLSALSSVDDTGLMVHDAQNAASELTKLGWSREKIADSLLNSFQEDLRWFSPGPSGRGAEPPPLEEPDDAALAAHIARSSQEEALERDILKTRRAASALREAQAAERHYGEVKDDIGQLESFIDTYPGLDTAKEGLLKEEAIEQLQKLVDQQWERRDTPTGRRLTAVARLEAAQAAYGANPTSKTTEDELDTAKKAYDALLGRRIEGVGGRFGQATPPKDFKGKVGDAPEDLSAEEAEVADIMGSRKIRETGGYSQPGGFRMRGDVTPKPSVAAQRGVQRADALREQIAQRKGEQEAFAAQQRGVSKENTLEAVLQRGGFRGDEGGVFAATEPPKQRFYRHPPPQVAVEPTLGPAPAPKEEPKEEPTVREQTQGAAKNALNNAGKAAKRKAYEAAGIF